MSKYFHFVKISFVVCASLYMLSPLPITAQQQVVQQSSDGAEISSIAPVYYKREASASAVDTTTPPAKILPANVNPFDALAAEAGATTSLVLKFRSTALDPEATATAEVAIRGRTLFIRVQAKNLQPPTRFGVSRYAVWAHVTNYGTRMYIGDLPVKMTSRNGGSSDSAFLFTNMPPDADFGGLILTVEPVRYEPIINEPLKPLLVGLTSDANQKHP